MKTKDILAEKGTRVITVQETLLLVDVVSMFFADRIGSVVVVNDHTSPSGIYHHHHGKRNNDKKHHCRYP